FDALGTMADKTQATQLATTLLGRAGMQLIPLIEHYSEIMPKATEQVREHGIGMDNMAAMSLKAHTEMQTLNMEIDRLTIQIGPPFIAFLSGVATGLETITRAGGGVVDFLHRIDFLPHNFGEFAASVAVGGPL